MGQQILKLDFRNLESWVQETRLSMAQVGAAELKTPSMQPQPWKALPQALPHCSPWESHSGGDLGLPSFVVGQHSYWW